MEAIGRVYTGALTFDMSCSRKWAKPACDCPFDGRVRPRLTVSGHPSHHGAQRYLPEGTAADEAKRMVLAAHLRLDGNMRAYQEAGSR